MSTPHRSNTKKPGLFAVALEANLMNYHLSNKRTRKDIRHVVFRSGAADYRWLCRVTTH